MTDHVTIADDVIIAGMSGVAKDMPDAGAFWGLPAQPFIEAKRINALHNKLPEIYRHIKQMEKRIGRVGAGSDRDRHPKRTLSGQANFEGLGAALRSTGKGCGPSGFGRNRFPAGLRENQGRPTETFPTPPVAPASDLVSTIEHMMSALALVLEITDAEVELDAPELPGMDGSSLEFVRGLLAAGLETIGNEERPSLFRRVFFHEGTTKIAAAKGDGHWRYEFETGERWPGTQSFEETWVVDRYAEEIAPARTFAFAEEIPAIIQMGLAKGLDESSALILGIDGYKNEARFTDEPARHKLLDLIGDLYLAGIPIRNLNVSSEQKWAHREREGGSNDGQSDGSLKDQKHGERSDLVGQHLRLFDFHIVIWV